jgi:hypothetical protein
MFYAFNVCISTAEINGKMSVNDEWERMWKERAWPVSRHYSYICTEEVKKPMRKLSRSGKVRDSDPRTFRLRVRS